MTAKIILNPYSARWRAQERFPEASSALKKAGVAFEVERSEKANDCVDLAEQAVKDGFSPIIAAGGDGTIGEVVNGIAKATPKGEDFPTFGVLPLGTANDLVHNLGLPLDFDEMAKIIASGKTRKMDLGAVNGRYFANNTALGLEPLVTVIQEGIGWLKGVPRYLYAALSGIYQGPGWHAEIKWDEGEYTGDISLISIGNGAVTGGLFYMTPHANLFDGKLTFSFGYRKSRLGLLATLPKLMDSEGKVFEEKEWLYEINTKKLSVKLAESSPAHTDGEIFTHELYEANYEIFPACLPILVGE